MVKLDLHTHIWEAFNFQEPSLSIAEKVVEQIKKADIDGIGITDHHNHEWARALKKIIDYHFPGEVIIIPGWEIEIRPKASPFDEYQVTELFLSENATLRIYCHPGYYTPNIIIEENIHGIEIDNYIHNWHIRKLQVEQIAKEHSLITVSVSDAHNLENVGLRYSEVDLQFLHQISLKA
jgi:PHP family Zn ribbon phosphoesterase